MKYVNFSTDPTVFVGWQCTASSLRTHALFLFIRTHLRTHSSWRMS